MAFYIHQALNTKLVETLLLIHDNNFSKGDFV
jgi:hypothetical protein